jgi:hypothetical protein
MTTPAREWTPRIWQGCTLSAWLRLLLRNRFAVSPRFFYIPIVVTHVSIGHSVTRLLQEAVYGDRPGRTPLKHPPIFIVGHWRTGTTLLHEMLILDPRHTFPDTYQCLEPNHFLLTEGVVKRWFRWMLPSRRPMDNMKAGWDRPQEDEFGLCMMGQPSPYLTIAFPNRPPQDQDAFDVRDLPPRQHRAWKRAFGRYLSEMTFRDPRRLVLKSPTHSCRIPTLLEMYPDAKFVHIMRDPYAVFPSTVNLWKALYDTHGLQVPTYAGLEEHVLSTFTMLYDRLEEGKRLIPPGQFHEVMYEDLIADPLGRMQALYDDLNLGGFEEARPRFEAYLRENAGYQTNRFPKLSDLQRETITRRWGPVIDRYGYPRRATP